MFETGTGKGAANAKSRELGWHFRGSTQRESRITVPSNQENAVSRYPCFAPVISKTPKALNRHAIGKVLLNRIEPCFNKGCHRRPHSGSGLTRLIIKFMPCAVPKGAHGPMLPNWESRTFRSISSDTWSSLPRGCESTLGWVR
jgi:hypothetical protein